jgi:putative Holliday junction resolvase
MPKILAIDYGTKRVGIATTDDMQIIASALASVHSNELIAFLENYCTTNKVEAIVVGLPKNLQNNDLPITFEVEKLIKHLNRKFPAIKIETIDERFTSKIASMTIAKSGLPKKKRQSKTLIDEISAVIILQDYLIQKSNGIR